VGKACVDCALVQVESVSVMGQGGEGKVDDKAEGKVDKEAHEQQQVDKEGEDEALLVHEATEEEGIEVEAGAASVVMVVVMDEEAEAEEGASAVWVGVVVVAAVVVWCEWAVKLFP